MNLPFDAVFLLSLLNIYLSFHAIVKKKLYLQLCKN